MGDMSAEPSMEDILASIKRVIKEGETQATPRRMSPPPPRAVPDPAPFPAQDDADDDGVLELNQPLAEAPRFDHAPPYREEPAPAAAPVPAPAPVRTAAVPAPVPNPAPVASSPASAVSPATAEAARDALGALSRLVVKPEPGSDGTLEGLVRDMLRPMVGEWLDANLPRLVEEMVAREIAKITDGPR